MKPRMLGRFLMTAVLLSGAGLAVAGTGPQAPAPNSDAAVVKAVRHQILMYPYYGVWDDVRFQVNEGQVTLQGAVTQPYKKSAIEKAVERVPGVTSVSDRIEILPLSSMDDRLRLRLVRAIYGDATLARYALNPQPPIRIIVDNGHVTLEGVVRTQTEKDVAGLRAAGVGLSFGPIINNLQVEMPSGKKS